MQATAPRRRGTLVVIGATVLTLAALVGSTAIADARTRHPSTSTSTSSTSSSTTTASTVAPATTSRTPLLVDHVDRPDGLITNEYAFWNPSAADAHRDPIWDLTSGSLFARGGAAWSGVPDDRAPNATSSNGTDSAILRAVTKRHDFTDVSVSLLLRNDGFTTTPSTPATAWDGQHIFLRYVDDTELYSASVDRRDGTTAIKKKVTGGTTNGGTYYTLATGIHPFTAGVFHSVTATIRDNADGSVTIRLLCDGMLVASATDSGTGGPVIRSGGVGLRGDNSEFTFDDFAVTSF